MTLQNILIIGPRETFADVAEHPELMCKLLVIDDGFKALLGFVKLRAKGTHLAGIYIHQSTGRVELPMYFEMLRAIESGMSVTNAPIWIAVRDAEKFEAFKTHKDLLFVDFPSGDTETQILDSFVTQINAFAASVAV